MIFLNLSSLDIANKLVKVCDKYNKHYIDVIHGRYVVDGRSLLCVCSMIGKIIRIAPVTDDKVLQTLITKDLLEIGAWVEDSYMEDM